MKTAFPFIFLLFMLNSALVSAQEEHLRLFQLNTNGEHIKAEAYVKPQKIKVNNQLFYYWIKAREIHFSQGGYEGNLLHGSFVCFYPSEQLKEQGRFYKGLKDGEWKKWHSNGTLAEVSQWNKGELSGDLIRYDSTGKMVYHAHYKKNELHGKEIQFQNDSIAETRTFRHGEEKVKKAGKPKKLKFRKSKIQPLEEKAPIPEPEEKKKRKKKSDNKASEEVPK